MASEGRDARPDFAGRTYVPLAEFTDPATQYTRYTGPVPLVTHLHGAVGVGDESDGYAEAWFLPNAKNVPAGYATDGTWYDFFASKASSRFNATWGRDSPSSSTRTTSASRRSGTTTTRWA